MAQVWCWADWVEKDIDRVLEAEKPPIIDSREKCSYFFTVCKVAIQQVICRSEQIEDGQILTIIENEKKIHILRLQRNTAKNPEKSEL